MIPPSIYISVRTITLNIGVHDPLEEGVDEWMLDLVCLNGSQVEAWYGVTQTRQVYEKAIKDLNEEGAREVGKGD